jgi:CRISPR-associated protein Cmr3
MWLFIEPSDVWLFRDGRPFDAGSDHRAASVFPPHPTTIQGALRRQVLALYGVDVDKYRFRQDVPEQVRREIGLPPPAPGKPGELGTIQLRGPFVARRKSDGIMPYFPCPADVIKVERVIQLRLEPQPEFAANWPEDESQLQPLVHDPIQPAEDSRDWLSAQSLSKYLAGQPLDTQDLVAERDLFDREGRFGVGLDDSIKRPSEGLLYQIEYVRPAKEVGLLVQVSGLREDKWDKHGLFNLGGEMRAARYEMLEVEPSMPRGSMADGTFKVYLATPARFDAGWHSTKWKGLDLTLRAAAVSRPQPIGGWDVALNRQKPMRRYVPAGSVYYFAGDPARLPEFLCDDATDGQIGFGHYYIGRQ